MAIRGWNGGRSGVEAMMRRSDRQRKLAACVWAVFTAGAVWAAGLAAQAGDGKWTLRVEPILMEVHGHDQHVLTVHELDLDSTPQVDNKTAVSLDTDSGLAYRTELQYGGEKWGWGVDFLWFNTSQNTPSLSAVPGATADGVAFEVADQSFLSFDPNVSLFYRVLEDTDLALWTLDFYGLRTLAEQPGSNIQLLFGLRTGDFDNDYRAVVGIEGIVGSRLDASSNYDRMMGPLLALVGNAERGKNQIRAYLGQSLLLGSAELTSMSRQFDGPFVATEMPSFLTQESFRSEQDVAIPITELRLNWTYSISRHLALGVGTNVAVWWDVPVPPGVIPVAGGDGALHENTLVLFGLLGVVEIRF